MVCSESVLRSRDSLVLLQNYCRTIAASSKKKLSGLRSGFNAVELQLLPFESKFPIAHTQLSDSWELSSRGTHIQMSEIAPAHQLEHAVQIIYSCKNGSCPRSTTLQS